MMRRAEGSGGFTLIEVMISAAVIAVMCAALLGSLMHVDINNRRFHDENVAYRACHQWIEQLMSEDLDSMLLQDGSTFIVNGMSAGAQTGTVTITDLMWGPGGGTADKAYEIRVQVPAANVTLVAVRTRT